VLATFIRPSIILLSSREINEKIEYSIDQLREEGKVVKSIERVFRKNSC
jgi:hypothetical protein